MGKKTPSTLQCRRVKYNWTLRRDAAQEDASETHLSSFVYSERSERSFVYLNRFFIFSRKLSSCAVSLSCLSSASFW